MYSDYDLVLMDVQMPEMDGEEAARRIRRELPAEKQPWIVAMTANVMKEDRERYQAVGMNDYIPKPVRIEHLISVLLSVQPINVCTGLDGLSGKSQV
jgi:CheY-like chemotaxis protein